MDGPCGNTSSMVHIVIAALSGATTVLTTWLTVRAKRKDRAEANGSNHTDSSRK